MEPNCTSPVLLRGSSCPSSPPPDAVWTLERILQNPPSAPKRRNHHPHHGTRHRRSLSNIPDELLSAWPGDNHHDDDDDDDVSEDEVMEARSPLVFLSPTSSSTSSSSLSASPSSTSSPPPAPTTFHAPQPSRMLGDPRRLFAGGSNPRLLFQHHSTSQLYVRPAAQLTRKHNYGHEYPHHPHGSIVVVNHEGDDLPTSQPPEETNWWGEEEDRQGSTRHLFERAWQGTGPAARTDTAAEDDSNDDDPRL